MRKWSNRLVVIVTVVVASLVHVYAVIPACIEKCFAQYQSVINQTATSPSRYRVLIPYVFDYFVPTASENIFTYTTMMGLVATIMVGVFVVVFYAWLRVWMDDGLAITNLLALTVILAAMFHAVWVIYDVTAILEVMLVIVGLVLMQYQVRGWRWWLIPVLILAMLNRATGGIIALMFFAIRFDEQREDWLWSAVYVGVAGAVFVGLRWWLGSATAETGSFEGTLFILRANRAEAILWNAAILPLFVLAMMNYRHLPHILRRALWTVPIYTFALLWRAEINEIGLWLTVMPVVIPAALWYLSLPKPDEQNNDADNEHATT